MSAAGANAFEGPAALMSRLFGTRATGMGGYGGQAGTEDKGETVPVHVRQTHNMRQRRRQQTDGCNCK